MEEKFREYSNQSEKSTMLLRPKKQREAAPVKTAGERSELESYVFGRDSELSTSKRVYVFFIFLFFGYSYENHIFNYYLNMIKKCYK